MFFYTNDNTSDYRQHLAVSFSTEKSSLHFTPWVVHSPRCHISRRGKLLKCSQAMNIKLPIGLSKYSVILMKRISSKLLFCAQAVYSLKSECANEYTHHKYAYMETAVNKLSTYIEIYYFKFTLNVKQA